MTEADGPLLRLDDLVGGTEATSSASGPTGPGLYDLPAAAPGPDLPELDVLELYDRSAPETMRAALPWLAPTAGPSASAGPSLYDSPAPAHPVPAHPVPAHPVPAHPVPAHPVPAHPNLGRLGAPALFRGSARISRGQVLAGAAVAAGAASGVSYLLRPDEKVTDLSVATGVGTGSGPVQQGGLPVSGGVSGGGTAPSSAPVAGPLALAKSLDVEHLLRRVTYGANDALREEVHRLGPTGWLTRQLAPAAIKDPSGDAVLALFPNLALSTSAAISQVKDGRSFQRDLAVAHLGRAIWSRRQLFEVMVDFWSNHFNITCPSDKTRLDRHRFDNDVIRTYALARFEDLLQATAIHPAMLEYLDNAESTGQSPNENYARELLELHTIGRSDGFTERDVKQAALLLTGYQVKAGAPLFVPSRHYAGAITVLGFSHPNASRSGGRAATQALLHYLAHHPSTATNVARRLAIRFVSDTPSKELIARLAQVYLTGDTAIVPVLTALFTSAEFAAAAGAKLRRPMERLAATTRVLGLSPGTAPQGLIDLYWMLDQAGHRPLGWPLPNGYPDVAAHWQSPAAALSQFNAAAQLAHGWWPKGLTNPGVSKLITGPALTRAAAIEAVGEKVLGRRLTGTERLASAKLLAASPLPVTLANGSWEQKETMGLIATLLLNSPAHVTR